MTCRLALSLALLTPARRVFRGAPRGLRQRLRAGQGLATFLIMPGSRVRVPPLLLTQQSLGRSAFKWLLISGTGLVTSRAVAASE
jgi:hypothetical protein